MTANRTDPDQGTVHAWSPRTRAGVVVLDNGRLVPFGTGAFDASGLRALRVGQRVRLEWTCGEVALVTILTLPDASAVAAPRNPPFTDGCDNQRP